MYNLEVIYVVTPGDTVLEIYFAVVIVLQYKIKKPYCYCFDLEGCFGSGHAAVATSVTTAIWFPTYMKA